MGGDWQYRTLGELTANFDSVRVPVKEADRRPGSYPYYGASGVVDRIDSYLFDGEYLLIAEDGENLRTRTTPIAFLARGRFWVNNHAHVVRGNDQADTRFLMYALVHADIGGYLTGSTMPKLTQANLRRIPVLAPPLAEQRAIAHILGTLDDKIELNRRMNETLEAMARALFKSWFVDFDPVRAKAAGRGTTLPRGLADHFPCALEQTGGSEIPHGWGTQQIYDCCDVIYGAPFKSSFFNTSKTGKPLIRIRDLASQTPGIWTTEEIPKAYLVRPGDLLVGMDGEFRAYLWCGPEGWLNQRVCCFRPKAAVPPAFVQYSVGRLLAYFERAKTGTTVIHLGKGEIDTFQVLRPHPDVLGEFGAIVGPISKRLLAASQEIKALVSLRDALLPYLIAGEVRVRDAERFLAGAVA